MCVYCKVRTEIYKLIESNLIDTRGLVNFLSDWKCEDIHCECNNCTYHTDKQFYINTYN